MENGYVDNSGQIPGGAINVDTTPLTKLHLSSELILRHTPSIFPNPHPTELLLEKYTIDGHSFDMFSCIINSGCQNSKSLIVP
jgi:hypothetical protein